MFLPLLAPPDSTFCLPLLSLPRLLRVDSISAFLNVLLTPRALLALLLPCSLLLLPLYSHRVTLLFTLLPPLIRLHLTLLLPLHTHRISLMFTLLTPLIRLHLTLLLSLHTHRISLMFTLLPPLIRLRMLLPLSSYRVSLGVTLLSRLLLPLRSHFLPLLLTLRSHCISLRIAAATFVPAASVTSITASSVLLRRNAPASGHY